jgi:hypothetical protein
VLGIGTILSLVLLDAMPQIDRFPRGQDFASYCRLVKGAKASGGKHVGTSGHKIGKAHLKWAFAAAATLCLRGHEPGPKYLARLEQKHATGQALSILAHKRARAVSGMLTRTTAFALEQFLRTSGSRASEPGAERDPEGMSLPRTGVKPRLAASVNAAARLGPLSLRPALCLAPRSGSCKGGG